MKPKEYAFAVMLTVMYLRLELYLSTHTRRGSHAYPASVRLVFLFMLSYYSVKPLCGGLEMNELLQAIPSGESQHNMADTSLISLCLHVVSLSLQASYI